MKNLITLAIVAFGLATASIAVQAKEIDMKQTQTADQLKKSCAKNGGSYTDMENRRICRKNGNSVECSKRDNSCIGNTKARITVGAGLSDVLDSKMATDGGAVQ